MLAPLAPHPVALVRTPEERTMVIADLHIGWEMALSQKGIHVPSQTPKLLNRLLALISEYKPHRLLILGDVKHTVASAELGEWHDVPDFFNELRNRVPEICVVSGNHDGNLEPLLPESVKVLPATGIVFGDVGFFHGHQWPSPAILGSRTLVMGHVHPVIAFRDPAGFRIVRQVWVKMGCEGSKLAMILLKKHKTRIEGTPEKTLLSRYGAALKAEHLLVMPSFNDFLGGRPLNEHRARSDSGKDKMSVGPVLHSDAVNARNAEVCLLDGTFLGTLSQLEREGR